MTSKTLSEQDHERAAQVASSIICAEALPGSHPDIVNLARCYLALEQSLRDLQAKVDVEYRHKDSCAAIRPGDGDCTCGLTALLDDLEDYDRE